MQAVIMAGGKGTRLSSVTGDLIPKPMVDFCGKPLIERLVDNLLKCGVKKFYIMTGHLGEIIENYKWQELFPDCKFIFTRENEPLGTAGSLYYLKGKIDEDFALVYADIITDVDYNRMLSFHRKNGAEITLFTHPNSHPYDSDIVVKDDGDRVTGFSYKDETDRPDLENLVNAGLFMVSPRFLDRVKELKKTALEKELISSAVGDGKVYAYSSPEYVKDVGTPDRLSAAEKDYLNGVVTSKNLSGKQSAVFLDRDGTINEYKGLVRRADDIELVKDCGAAIRKLNDSKYLSIVITNQPVIARGEVSYEELKGIHNRMYTLLGKDGAYVNDLFFCPHHPDKGFEGEIEELKIDCECRKPKAGMIFKAQEKYNIDLSSSFMVGDTYRDIMTGKNAGVKTVLIEGKGTTDRDRFPVTPDYKVKTLSEAVNIILGE